MERTKDEEAKKFQAHKIQFDFNILVRIKELMVDLSSGCMELALKVCLLQFKCSFGVYNHKHLLHNCIAKYENI